MRFETERLVLRSWTPEDTAPFAALCADPEVMEFFEVPLTFEDAAVTAGRIRAREAQDGFCMWALELPGVAPFIGFTGIQRVPFEAAFTPAVETGWRLARPFWGHGYASEAASAALADGFTRCGLTEIVAMAVPANIRSIAVMEKIGMRRDMAADFDHLGVTVGHRLRRHVLYRTRKNPE